MSVISNKNMQELLDEDRKRSGKAVPESSVLDGSGRLTVTGRYASEPAPFDRGRLPAPKRLFRLKETESFNIMSDPLFMRISAGDAGYAGFVTVTAVNRRTGRQKTRTCVYPFTFGSMEMPPSPSRGDMMLRRGDVSLDFSRSPAARYIRCRFEDFDDVRALYINLETELPDAHAPSGKKDARTVGAYYALDRDPGRYKRNERYKRYSGFGYSSYVPCMRTSGTVVIGADRFEFTGDQCFSSYEWFRGVPARKTRTVSLTVCGGTDGSRLGISVSPDGTMLHDESHMTVSGPIGFDPDESELADPLTVTAPEGRLELHFMPLFEERECRSFAGLMRCEDRLIFGMAEGSCRTDDSGTVKFSDLYALVRRSDARW